MGAAQDADANDWPSDGEQTVTDRDQTLIFSLNGDSSQPERFGSYDDFTPAESQPAGFAPGLVSLGFIKAAVRRSALFVSVAALAGLILGLGAYTATPHHYQAAATILLTHGPYEDVQTAANNNQVLAKTRTVAASAEHDLGLQQSVSSFLASYTVTAITDRVLVITASAPTAGQAVQRASAVGGAFLTFRAAGMQDEQSLVVQSLDQQVTAAQQRVSAINAQISKLSGGVDAVAQQPEISGLQAQLKVATSALGSLEQAVTGNQTTTLPAVTAALKGSQVLSVAALPRSKLKPLATYALAGLIAALALSLSIVLVRALVSDRLRQRDDIAYALDAPVKLSVGPLRARRWRPAWPGRAARRKAGMRRVIAHLQNSVPRSIRGPAALATVAVDNAPVAARAVAALATFYASKGQQVVVADLSRGAHLARLLRVKRPGVHTVTRNGVSYTVTVPERDYAAPAGPLRAASPAEGPAGPVPGGDAYSAAEVLLTLVTLDPALGGDHLATWATKAVVLVSTGLSSAERIRGVGEMIRLAGTRLDSVVLIGADSSDESLGRARRSDEQADVGALSN
jgi:capsular polysaccharide biosynthesis protein